MQYTKEQEQDIANRAQNADKEIKDILSNYELSIIALPVFNEVAQGQCSVSSVIQFRDVKYLPKKEDQKQEEPAKEIEL